MTQRIDRFSVGQTAKVAGVLYLLLGLIFSPIFLMMAVVAPNEAGAGFGIWFAIALPLLYALAGFIFTAIGCAFYNLVAGWVGGIEVDLGNAAP